MTSLFLAYLGGYAQQASALYILGDLFDAWVGDDDDDPYLRKIITALKTASSGGTAIHIQHGNRDFLLGSQFALFSGCQLIEDPYLLKLPQKSLLLSHGDALCTEDREYQLYRTQVRSTEWQNDFLARPLSERRAFASQLRLRSEQSKMDKEHMQMDLDERSIELLLRQYPDAFLIHGHTHRPQTHRHRINGNLLERWVLSDWHEERGEILVWDGKELNRQPLSLSLPLK